jgi:hypothetical protein
MFFSTGRAWGTIVFQEKKDGSCAVTVEPVYGSFELCKLCIDGHTHDLGRRDITPESGLAFTTPGS